ncbi:AraC family transcriptional regulator [Geodermatophilus sp. SYSU D00815]
MPADGPPGDDRGILHPRTAETLFDVRRHAPSPRLAAFASYLWTVEWALPAGRGHVQRILPNPSVHLSFEPDRARVTGPPRRSDSGYELSGRGRVVGVRFRPGGARPWLTGPVSALTDTEVPVRALVDLDADAVRAEVAAAPDAAAAAALVDAVLTPLCPPPDPAVDRADGLVALVDAEPGIRRVEDLAARLATTPRSLQRFCAGWIGVGPKELVRWARLHEAAGRAAAGPVDWAALAAELGYADQAHLVRDFTRVVGEPPARYARAQASG